MEKRSLLAFMLVSVFTGSSALADPSREQALAAMKKAAAFMVEHVALRGGYVWAVSEDLTTRWGEIPARPSQIWVQAATPTVAEALLDAHDATGDLYYLDGARKAIDALLFGQHPLGGWHYFVDFDPEGTRAWYDTHASRFTFGFEEYRHFYGNATHDDRVTSDTAATLLRFYETTREPAYRAPLLKALGFVVESQFPNGAWPQRYPPRDEYRRDGFPDYTSYYTLNDGVMIGNVELLLKAAAALGDDRYVAAARRAADFLIAVQGPEGQAAWAEQYGHDLKPIRARSHEPAGYVVRESQDAIYVLELFYLLTGERKYLLPIPGCLAWFDRINREAIALKRPPARYWEPGTNLPVYVLRTSRRTPDGYGIVEWTTSTPPTGSTCWSGPCETTIRPIVDVAPIRATYEHVSALTAPDARRAFAARFSRLPPRPPVTIAEVEAAISSMDARGAWVTDDVMVHPIVDGMNPGDRVAIRGVATATFVRNLGALTQYVRATAPARDPVVHWPIDNVAQIGGYPVKVVGSPRVVKTGETSAVEFNGSTDGLFIDVNPLAGLERFTIEVLLLPAADGPEEQRFLHIEEAGSANRALVELRRLPDGSWCLDTYLRHGDAGLTLIDRGATHPAGRWYAVALTYDGKTMAHYVNGVREASGGVRFGSLGPGRTSIGVRQNLVSWFKGRIAVVRVTPEALSPARLLVPPSQ